MKSRDVWVILPGMTLLLGLLGLIGWVTVRGLPAGQNTEVVMLLYGSMSTLSGMFFSWLYGSTKGSSDKTQAIVDAAKSSNAEHAP